jgi:hypothetical protein
MSYNSFATALGRAIVVIFQEAKACAWNKTRFAIRQINFDAWREAQTSARRG